LLLNDCYCSTTAAAQRQTGGWCQYVDNPWNNWVNWTIIIVLFILSLILAAQVVAPNLFPAN